MYFLCLIIFYYGLLCRALFTTTLNQNESNPINTNNNITIPGIDSMVFKKIIDYAYLRKCYLTEDSVYEIFVIADYVGMIGLIKICEKFLLQILTPTNCISIMLFAR